MSRNAFAVSHRHCENDEVEIYLKNYHHPQAWKEVGRRGKERFISVTAHQLTSSLSFFSSETPEKQQ